MLTCGFFNSIKRDRRYYPYQFTDMFSMLMPNGVCSSIGNGFACEMKDIHTIKIRSGLAFFDGYYVYNNSEMEYRISEEVYPQPSLMSIYVETTPTQTEYPSGNRLDLDGMTVMGVKSTVEVSNIFIDQEPQTEYPAGNTLDLGDIRVRAELEAVEEGRTGDCYIVLEFSDRNRSFEIKAINTNDYISTTHHVLAVCHKSPSGLVCENVVGKTMDNILTTKWITGMWQGILIDDILDDFEYSEDEFLNTFKSEKENYWTNWIENNKYYLYHSDESTQYSRLTEELGTKEDLPTFVYGTAVKGTTSTSVYVPNLPTDAVISFKSNPYGLIIEKLSVTNNYITVGYKEADRTYSICFVIR